VIGSSHPQHTLFQYSFSSVTISIHHIMNAFILVCLLFSTLVRAFTITEPNSGTGWVVNSTQNRVVWSSDQSDPATFDIRLINSNGSILQGAYAIANSVPKANQTVLAAILNILPGNGYTVIFTNQSQSNQTYTTSQSFTILPAGSSQPTPTPTPTTSSNSATSTGNSSSGGSGGHSPNARVKVQFSLGLLIVSVGLALIG